MSLFAQKLLLLSIPASALTLIGFLILWRLRVTKRLPLCFHFSECLSFWAVGKEAHVAHVCNDCGRVRGERIDPLGTAIFQRHPETVDYVPPKITLVAIPKAAGEAPPPPRTPMKTETERKFLVDLNAIGDVLKGLPPKTIGQAYLSDKTPYVRVRLTSSPSFLNGGERGFLTIKGKKVGATSPEYEYPIPPQDARDLMSLATTKVITKKRYDVPYNGRTWEVDVFEGVHAGLVVAEIEYTDDGPISIPDWAVDEVTNDHRYSNVSLALHGMDLLNGNFKGFVNPK